MTPVRVLGLIPARGGSKGVPGKNLHPLAGKSLVRRAHECALEAGVLDRVVLSTDDPRIAEAARAGGLEVPFLRPEALAGDATPMIDVVLHALAAFAAKGYRPDAVMLLQPTSPLRRPGHVREAVRLLEESGADAVCSVVAVPPELRPHYVMRIRDDGSLDYFLPEGRLYRRRQDVPPAYRRDGTVYLARTATLERFRDFYGERCVPLFVDPEDSLSIDDPAQWADAERRVAAREAPRTPQSEASRTT